nr:MAG TPA: hypothetical protein [Caudoviricetes sp.]
MRIRSILRKIMAHDRSASHTYQYVKINRLPYRSF